MTSSDETFSDRILNFTLPARHARGRAVRLDGVADAILSAHDYPLGLRHVLAEALVLTALMGSLLKQEDGQLTIQAQTEGGIVDLLVCDYRGGELRGYARFDRARADEIGPQPTLEALFGIGYLAVTFDLDESDQRYQGVVPLEGGSLTEACEAYFAQSEQLPTLLRVGVQTGPEGTVAAGLLLQHLAEGEEGRERLHVRLDHPEWEHVAIMGGSIKHGELVDRDLSMEALVWRLFHEEDEVRAERGAPVARGCRCSADYYRSVLERFPASEREEMRGDDGAITVDCAFCAREFPIDI